MSLFIFIYSTYSHIFSGWSRDAKGGSWKVFGAWHRLARVLLFSRRLSHPMPDPVVRAPSCSVSYAGSQSRLLTGFWFV